MQIKEYSIESYSDETGPLYSEEALYAKINPEYGV